MSGLSGIRPSGRLPGIRRADRRRYADDAGFAILYTLVFVMLLTSFSLLMLSQVTSEIRQTQFDRKHEQTLNSAMAGLNAGLSKIRNSVTLNLGIGVIALIPCQLGARYGTISGATDAAGKLTWKTDIYYLAQNPAQMTLAQVQAAALPCPLTIIPAFAYLISSGDQAALDGATSTTFGDRTVHATYQFGTSNISSAGGQVGYNNMCWDAGPSPAAGSPVTFQTCIAGGTPSQNWFYRPDLTVQWYGDQLRDLCLDSRSIATAALVKYMTLENCATLGLPGTAYNSIGGSYLSTAQMYQEFSENVYWNNVVPGGAAGVACISSYGGGLFGQAMAGDQLVMAATCSGAATAIGTAGVGPGGANALSTGLPGPTQQLVNKNFFNRCIDVKASTPAQGLITTGCQQLPDQTRITGDQQFQYSGTPLTSGPITTSQTGLFSTVCLQGGASAVTLAPCVLFQANQQWRMTSFQLGQYSESYVIKDYRGYCLTAGAPSGGTGDVSLGVCTGLDSQKWNAPPAAAQTQLQAVGEQ